MIEYLTINTAGLPLTTEQLNQLGADGWQLVAIPRDVAYFSRPKVEPQPQPKRRKVTK